MLATFNGTWDWTAIGTLVLAAATFISLFFARSALKKTQDQIELGQEQLAQTQREIELSRKEVEEAHRPVVVPYIDPTTKPSVADGMLRIPLQNVGSGPALQILAFVKTRTAQDILTGNLESTYHAGSLTAIAAAVQIVWLDVPIRIWGELKTFELSLTYEDLADKKWTTVGIWNPTTQSYDVMSVRPNP